MQDAQTMQTAHRGAVPRRGSAEARPGLKMSEGETWGKRGGEAVVTESTQRKCEAPELST